MISMKKRQMMWHDLSIKKIAEWKPHRGRKSRQDGSMLPEALSIRSSLQSVTSILIELKERWRQPLIKGQYVWRLLGYSHTPAQQVVSLVTSTESAQGMGTSISCSRGILWNTKSSKLQRLWVSTTRKKMSYRGYQLLTLESSTMCFAVLACVDA
jgi:hypothetical protein